MLNNFVSNKLINVRPGSGVGIEIYITNAVCMIYRWSCGINNKKKLFVCKKTTSFHSRRLNINIRDFFSEFLWFHQHEYKLKSPFSYQNKYRFKRFMSFLFNFKKILKTFHVYFHSFLYLYPSQN